MDLKQIEYIVKIDDEHSITRAAEKLFVTQSALNQQLLRLEKELGAPLFHRSKIDMRPTEIGQVIWTMPGKSCGSSSAPTTS